MIISASRRTDIPAFYSEWFMNRIKAGYIMSRNPMNFYQVSKISLDPKVVDCIVFWTKNPAKMMQHLSYLDEMNYKYYFQFTLNPYPRYIEKELPDHLALINIFKDLSKKIGKEKVVWRYDPIFLTDRISINYHLKAFEKLAHHLSGYTERCVISFIDMYKKCERNLKSLNVLDMDESQMREIAGHFARIGKKYGIQLETCAEAIDLDELGIKHGKCIDDKLISKIIGFPLDIKKDKNQRPECGCVSSIDVGAYNSCAHHCLYCYANYNYETVEKNRKEHDVNSPFLIGNSSEKDKVTERKMNSYVADVDDWIKRI